MYQKSITILKLDLKKYKDKMRHLENKTEGRNKFLRARHVVELEISRRHVEMLEEAKEIIQMSDHKEAIDWLNKINDHI
tara:strand:+ start:52 stop:288 length:237 start_codon:yes stop_codon:yes gene_type:complete